MVSRGLLCTKSVGHSFPDLASAERSVRFKSEKSGRPGNDQGISRFVSACTLILAAHTTIRSCSISVTGGTGAGTAVGYFDFFVTGCSDFLGSSVRKFIFPTLKSTMNGSLVNW
jgi:hypothetical protein